MIRINKSNSQSSNSLIINPVGQLVHSDYQYIPIDGVTKFSDPFGNVWHTFLVTKNTINSKHN